MISKLMTPQESYLTKRKDDVQVNDGFEPPFHPIYVPLYDNTGINIIMRKPSEKPPRHIPTWRDQ